MESNAMPLHLPWRYGDTEMAEFIANDRAECPTSVMVEAGCAATDHWQAQITAWKRNSRRLKQLWLLQPCRAPSRDDETLET